MGTNQSIREIRKRTLWQGRLGRAFELPDYVIIMVVVLVAVSFRILHFLQLMANSPSYNLLIHDSALFNELARSVLNKGLILDQPFYISPLYIYFLAVIYKVLGSTIDVVRLIQFGLGVGTAVLTFAIAKTFLGKRVGSLAGLLAAVYAPFLFFEGNLLGTAVATFCLTASLFCLVYANPKWSGYLLTFASGLFLALAVTGRPNLLLLVPIPILFLFVNRRRLGKTSFVFAALTVLGIAIPTGLTGLHNYHAGGQFNLLTTHGGINFYIGNHENASGTWEAPEGIEASVSAINLVESKRFAEEATNRELTASQVSGFWYKRALSFMINHPVQWGSLLLRKFLMFWSGYEAPINFDYYFHQQYSSLLKFPLLNLAFYMPLAILGLILCAQKWREYWILYATIGISCVSVVMFFMGDRYRIVVMPLLIIMASAGIVRFFDLMRVKGSKRLITLISLLLLFAIEIGYTQKRISRTNYANDYYNLSLAHLINEDPESAVYWGQRAIVEDPSLKNAHYNLGVAYLKSGDRDKALDAFLAVIQIDPTVAGAHRNVGGLLLIRHEYEKALPHLKKSLEYEADNIISLMNLGLAYYYLTEYEEAIDAWELLLKLDPQNEQAKNNIQAAKRFL